MPAPIQLPLANAPEPLPCVATNAAERVGPFSGHEIAHNTYEAERDYGTSFMASKRRRKVATKPLKGADLGGANLDRARYTVATILPDDFAR